MLIELSFGVPATVEHRWNTVHDVSRVASGSPGATRETSALATDRGPVGLADGPIGLADRGDTGLATPDETIRLLALLAQGKATRGSGGTSQARVTTALDPLGKPAHVGRSTSSDVGPVPVPVPSTVRAGVPPLVLVGLGWLLGRRIRCTPPAGAQLRPGL